MALAQGDCVSCDYEGDVDYQNAVKMVYQHYIRDEVAAFLSKYDKWLMHKARQVERNWKLRCVADDLKSEMQIEAFNAAFNRFDPSRGVPLATFLLSTLWRFCSRNDVISRYKRHNREVVTVNHGSDYSDHGELSSSDIIPVDKYEKSSLELSHNVFSLIADQPEGYRMLLNFRFQIGMTPKQIDDLLGSGHSTSWHRINKILADVREKHKASDYNVS